MWTSILYYHQQKYVPSILASFAIYESKILKMHPQFWNVKRYIKYDGKRCKHVTRFYQGDTQDTNFHSFSLLHHTHSLLQQSIWSPLDNDITIQFNTIQRQDLENPQHHIFNMSFGLFLCCHKVWSKSNLNISVLNFYFRLQRMLRWLL